MSFNNKVPINFIEYTFDSTFSCFRDGEVQMPNGSWKTQKNVKMIDSAKCGLYVHRAEEYDQRRSVQPLTGDFKIFTYRNSDIKKGDVLKVEQYGVTYTMICGEPINYETHLEVVCREKGLA